MLPAKFSGILRFLKGGRSGRQVPDRQNPPPREISAHQHAEMAALRQAIHQYEALLESLRAIVWRGDPATYQLTYVSKEAESLLGYPLEAWTTEHDFWQHHIHPEDREWVIYYCARETEALRSHAFEYRMIAADGRVVWLYDAVELVIEDGRPREQVGVMVDITERKHMEEKLKLLAEKDFLTGIYNRRKFQELLKSEIDRIKRYPKPLSLIMFDIDNFKRINDSLGHAAGDDVIREVAAVTGENIRETDVFARYGGEEFVILALETGLAEAQTIAEKIRHALQRHGFGAAGNITASFGVTELRENDTLDSFLKRADQALYEAKKQGKNIVVTGPTLN